MKEKEERNIKGRWWLPSAPEHKITGTLSYDFTERGQLDLSAMLGSEPFSANPASSRMEIIYGESFDGKLITLFDCQLSSWTFGSPENPTIVTAKEIFEGDCFVTKDSNFISLMVSIKNLEPWVGNPGIKPEHKFEGLSLKSIEIAIPILQPRLIYESDNLRIKLGSSLSTNFRPFKAEASEHAYIIVEFKKSLKFQDALEEMRYFLSFIALGLDSPIQMLKLEGRIEGQAEKHWLKISTTRYSNQQVSEWQRGDRMLFDYSSIEGNQQIIIDRWLNIRDQVLPILGLRNALRNSNLYYETQVLFVAQAIETFHRRFFGSSYMSKTDFMTKIFPQIQPPSGIDQGFAESLKNKLKYGYEFSLRKRLKEIISKIPAPLIKAYITTNAESFVADAVKLRNYYTHYDDLSIEKISRSVAAFWLPMRLTLILDYHLLAQIGFSEQDAEKLISNKYVDCVIRSEADWNFEFVLN